ncbi:MAG: hypothetical protein OES46_19505 [Gammaproteobacteria bacterium]|nr:hypothetical protein [Gammaproteobacteria bacterium]
MTILIMLNDPPDGTARSYNGLQLASGILKSAFQVRLYLFLAPASGLIANLS